MSKLRWYEAHTEIAKFALPILKDFYIRKSGYPGDLHKQMYGDDKLASEKWDQILRDIIIAFEHLIDEDWNPNLAQKKKQQESFELFGKWFIHLWD